METLTYYTLKKNILLEKSFHFAVHIVELVKELQLKKEFVLSKQLLRSGTSIGANVREANNTQTRKDFIYKLSIAQKECDETIYWMDLLFETGCIRKDQHHLFSVYAEEQLKIIKSSILTARSKLN